MCPKVTRKKPTSTTQHNSTHYCTCSSFQCPRGKVHTRASSWWMFISSARHSRASQSLLATLGSPAHIPAQSNAARGTGELGAAREGTGECAPQLVHSRSIASLPTSPGRTPLFQKAMTLSVDMTITHRVLSKAQT